MNITETEVDTKIRERLKSYYQDKLGLSDWEKRAQTRIKLLVSENHVKRLEGRIDLKDKKILDVGSGLGDFVMSASIHGATSFGIEPDKEWVKLSKLWLEASGISALLCMGAGEDLPFKDDVFDIVSCNFVLEHTKSPARVIEEMVRVLRPGGYCYLNVPNYIFPWEHHYKIIWSLILPKLLTRSYLQLRGRDPEYMDHIYPITSTFIFRTLGKLNIKIVANLVDDAIRDPDEIISGRWKILSHMIRTLHIPIQFINLISPVTSIIVTNSAQDSDIKSNRPYKNK